MHTRPLALVAVPRPTRPARPTRPFGSPCPNRAAATLPALLFTGTLLLTGCVGSGFRSNGFRGPTPSFPNAGAGVQAPDAAPGTTSAPPFTGAGTPSAGPTPAPETLGPSSAPSAPKTFESDYGPSLSLPEARRRKGGAAQAAFLEAPAPRRSGPGGEGVPMLAARFAASGDRSLTRISWNRYFRSADRRMIDSVILGDGPTKIAILASVHGDQPQSVALVDLLAQHLSDTPNLLAGRTILIVRNPNPDGLFARTSGNVEGVDLNRNFPAANWKVLPDGRAGKSASSEPETRAIVRMLLEFQPQLVVHVRDYDGGTYLNTEGQVPHAPAVAAAARGEVLTGLGGKTSGSLEAWSTDKLSAGVLTLMFPDEQSPARAWTRYKDPLIAAVRDYGVSTTPDAAAGSVARKPNPPTKPTSSSSAKPPAAILEEDLDDFDADRDAPPPPPAPAAKTKPPKAGAANAGAATKPRAPQIDDTEDDAAFERPGAPPKTSQPVPSNGYFELPESPPSP